jgi:ribosome maturation protein Sdo1
VELAARRLNTAVFKSRGIGILKIVAETGEVQMTLDERLERLTERHEALTQTVELMAMENRQRDRRLGEIMEGIASLLHIAKIHEQRLDQHGDRLDNLQ